MTFTVVWERFFYSGGQTDPWGVYQLGGRRGSCGLLRGLVKAGIRSKMS